MDYHPVMSYVESYMSLGHEQVIVKPSQDSTRKLTRK